MEAEVKILRDQGKTWGEVAKTLNVSVSTARRYHKKEPEFPRTHEGIIYRRVINPRMILVKIGDDVVPAVIRQGLHYPQGQKVSVQQIDEKHYRVV
jgi:hypothetical protein